MNTDLLTYVKANLAQMRPVEFERLRDLTGVSHRTIEKINSGEVADPRISTVQALYNYFAKTNRKAA